MGLGQNILLGSAFVFAAFATGLNLADKTDSKVEEPVPRISCMGNVAGDEKEEIVYLDGSAIYYIQDRGPKKPVCILRGPGLKDVGNIFLDDFDGNGLEDLTLLFNDVGSISVLTYANFGEDGFYYEPNGFNYEPQGHKERAIYRVVQE